MPNPQSRKGDRHERTLVNCLDALGYAVIRAPSSGSATTRELPDVLAGSEGLFYAFELKSASGSRLYIEQAEVDDLVHFATMFGAEPRIAVRFDLERGDDAFGEATHPGFYVREIEDLYRTDSGNYRVDKQQAVEVGTPVQNLPQTCPASVLEDIAF